MYFTTTDHGTAGVDGVPVVVGECDEEVAAVFGAIAVAVADNGTFPVVVEPYVADCYIVHSVSDVKETIVVVLSQ